MKIKIIASFALLSLFFVFPPDSKNLINPADSLSLLLLAATGILLSKLFILSSEKGDKIGIEPAVIVCLATWETPSIIYPITALMAFSGSLLNAMRMQKKLSTEIVNGIYQGISFLLLLKVSTFLYSNFQSFFRNNSIIQTYLIMIILIIIVTLIRSISICFCNFIKEKSFSALKKEILLNSFIILPAIPSAWAASQINSANFSISVYALSLFSMLFIHGINLRINRSAHEKTNELETILKLNKLSSDLFSTQTEIDALRILNKAVSEAWDCKTVTQWKSLKYFDGEFWDTANAVHVQHDAGLIIWIDSFNSTIPLYFEAFLNRAIPVLTGLEAEKKMERTSWESVEAMISFVEKDKSDFAGFSRRVANTTSKLCIALEKDLWFHDCMRLAGLLHTISLPKEKNSNHIPHSLPEITIIALKNMMEHWSGTGPAGQSHEEIPLASRILAVSIAWEKGMNSGVTMAIRDMHMKAGTIYDPRLTELIIQLNS